MKYAKWWRPVDPLPPNGFDMNLERAFLIAYAMEHDVIVGNSSLKRPRKAFIERINNISGMNFTHFFGTGIHLGTTGIPGTRGGGRTPKRLDCPG